MKKTFFVAIFVTSLMFTASAFAIQEFTNKVSDNCTAGVAFDLGKNVAYCADDSRVGNQVDLSVLGPYFFTTGPKLVNNVTDDCTAGVAIDIPKGEVYCADDPKATWVDPAQFGPYYKTQ